MATFAPLPECDVWGAAIAWNDVNDPESQQLLEELRAVCSGGQAAAAVLWGGIVAAAVGLFL